MSDKANSNLLTILRNNMVALAVAFALFVFLFLLPQLVFYRGIISQLAEWQFNWFGNYFPILTVAIPVFVLTLIFLLILWLILRLKRNTNDEDAAITLTERATLSMSRTRLAMRSFFILSLLALVGAIGALILMINLPNADGKVQDIDVGTLPFAVPAEGPAKLNGALDWQKLTTIKRNLVLVSQRTYFIPIVSRVADRKSTRYFVQVFRPEFVLPKNRIPGRAPEWEHLLEEGEIKPTKDGPVSVVNGVLRQGGLPEEIVRLYRKAGVEVHPDHYVLYRNLGDLKWPYWTSAIQFFLLSLGALLIGLYQRRQLKRLKKGMANIQPG